MIIRQVPRQRNINLKLDVRTHRLFKVALCENDVSMQAALEYFAREVGAGKPAALAFLSKLKRDQAREALAVVGLKPLRTPREFKESLRQVGELDVDTLYDLIEGDNADEGPQEAKG